MTGTKAIVAALELSRDNLMWYLSDFTDADMLVRPVPGANHAAWQVGNVVVGDVMLVTTELPRTAYPELPAGFVEKHGKSGAATDEGFLTKAEYLSLLGEVRAATIGIVAQLSDADLDAETSSELRDFAPTLGKLLIQVSNHTLWHSGQFTVIRRKLGKPVLF